MKLLSSFLALVSVFAASASSQDVTIQFLTPGSFDQAIGISTNGTYVVGGGPSNGFLWSDAGGLVTGFGSPIEFWDVTNDGQTAVGTAVNGSGDEEAAVWTVSGGLQLLGNALGATGCDSFLSHLNGVSADGSTAVGMSWQGCRTSPMRWTSGGGLTLLAKQWADSSARCYGVSDDGLMSVGWDQGLSTGPGSTRRACLWTDDVTQTFPATTATNPAGFGECTDINSDGSVVCGTTQGQAFRWTSSGGLDLLPNVSGLPGNYTANGISEDGSVVAGVRIGPCCPPTLDGILWTDATGPVRIVDWLATNGVFVTAGQVQNATGVSADGNTICGWGTNGAWVIAIDDDPWTDLGGGTAGVQGVPGLSGSGPLTGGSTLTLTLVDGPFSNLILLWIADAPTPGPAIGGTLHAFPFIAQVVLATDAGGGLVGSTTWPTGVPAGFEIFFQFICLDAVSPFGLTLSNGLRGTTP